MWAFWAKNVNFLILTKLFYIYSYLTVVIDFSYTFEQKSQNVGLTGRNQSSSTQVHKI